MSEGPGAAQPPVPCRVCRAAETRPFARVRGRAYFRCGRCAATQMSPADLPDPCAEAARYRQHHNEPEDEGYRRFLGRLAEPLLARLKPGCEGLDYGCGPGPLLARMLRGAGQRMSLYDPVFAPDPALLSRRYDFITASEVAEHFHKPAEEFDRLAGLLKPGGILALMTCFQTHDAAFPTWHYVRDFTHVVFYREETLRRIAADRNLRVEIPQKDLAFFFKA